MKLGFGPQPPDPNAVNLAPGAAGSIIQSNGAAWAVVNRQLMSGVYTWGGQDMAGGTSYLWGDYLALATGGVEASSNPRRAPYTGRSLKLGISHSTPVGASALTYTLRVNGVDSLFVVNLASNAPYGEVTGSIAFVSGDLFTIKVVNAGAVVSTQTVAHISFQETY